MTILINVTMSSNELQFSIHLDSLLAMVAGAMIVITVLLLSILVICLRHLRQSFESSIVIVDGSANAANYLVNGHVNANGEHFCLFSQSSQYATS